MLVRQLYDDDLAQASYLIGCERTGEAIVIDPERDVDRYIAEAEARDMRITAVAETHIHADFLSGARELCRRVGARAYLSAEGGPDWLYQWPEADKACEHQFLRDGDGFVVGNIRFRAVHTPGHTPEHLSYEVYDAGADEPIAVLTGDFVFVGDLGRPDLLETAAKIEGVKEESARELYRSTKRLASVPEFTQVWPAHGAGSACGKSLGAIPQSTLGYERRHNDSLRIALDEPEGFFVEKILGGQPAPPMYFARMKKQNKEGPPILGEMPKPARRPAAELASLGREIVLFDLRAWDEFQAAHVPGSIWAPAKKTFLSMVAGSYAEPEDRIALVCEPEELERATRVLVRIGLDRVESWTPASELGEIADRLEPVPQIDPEAARARMDEVMILDARNPDEYDDGHVEGAVNIPYTRLPERLGELPSDRDIVTHCQTGVRSAAATSYLLRRGLRAVNLAGGYAAWNKALGTTESAQA